MIIFVKDSRNRVLYPTHKQDWAEKLVKRGDAKWVRHKIIWLQLNYPVLEEPRDQLSYFVVGKDPGYGNIGYKLIKITGKTAKILAGGTLFLRTALVHELMEQRSMYRKAKRQHKRNKTNSNKRRIPRWKNRSKNRSKMNPTKRHLVNSHIRTIELLANLVPCEKLMINLEYAKFDLQQISQTANPAGLGYDNMKNYIKARDNYACRYCGKKNCVLEVHHKIQRKDGGTNRPANLITLCTKCHKDHHKGKIDVNGIKPPKFKAASVLNSCMKLIYNELAAKYPVYKYYGYETSARREELGLEKTHENDALVLALFGIEVDRVIDYNLHKDYHQFRRHDRKRTSRYEDRKYYLTRKLKKDGTYSYNERVANNRNSRCEQKNISLAEYRKKNLKTPVYATPGGPVMKRPYNEVLYRPGDLVRDREGKIHIVSSWASTQNKVYILGGRELSVNQIVKIKSTSGFV